MLGFLESHLAGFQPQAWWRTDPQGIDGNIMTMKLKDHALDQYLYSIF